MVASPSRVKHGLPSDTRTTPTRRGDYATFFCHPKSLIRHSRFLSKTSVPCPEHIFPTTSAQALQFLVAQLVVHGIISFKLLHAHFLSVMLVDRSVPLVTSVT